MNEFVEFHSVVELYKHSFKIRDSKTTHLFVDTDHAPERCHLFAFGSLMVTSKGQWTVAVLIFLISAGGGEVERLIRRERNG